MTRITGVLSRRSCGWLPLRRSARSITYGNTVLNRDFSEFVDALNASNARYLVVTVCFIGLDDLKASKAASGRHQDLADLENLD